jgi:hypothetical protein
MRYRVVYRKRFGQTGRESDAPASLLNLPDGIVAEVEFVERLEPPSLHVEENMEEDDDFLPFGSEVWEYDVADGREQEFRDAVRNTGVALEVERVEEVEDLPAVEGQ